MEEVKGIMKMYIKMEGNFCVILYDVFKGRWFNDVNGQQYFQFDSDNM